MKVVIDIDENDFLACKYWFHEGVAQWAEVIIAKGTVLPKGHGDLIDRDTLNLDYEVLMADDWKTAHEIANCVKYAPTVIEADK